LRSGSGILRRLASSKTVSTNTGDIESTGQAATSRKSYVEIGENDAHYATFVVSLGAQDFEIIFLAVTN
jgi:hypothetical protein